MIRRASLSFLALAIAPATAAQTTVTLMHDNDEWFDTDREYTEGSRLSAVSRDWGRADWAQTLARWLPGVEPGEGVSAGFGLGYYLYVPENIATTTPVPNERPYASWLHASALLTGEKDRTLDTWKLDLGVVGPSAQGEHIVTFFHSAFSGREMNGWDDQIEDRLGLQAAWERRWRNISDLGGGWQLDVSPAIGIEAGTVSIAADAGVTLRLGSNLAADFAPPRTGPLGGSVARTSGDGWSGYLFASANGRYQPYDVFLDEPGGSTSDPIRGGQAISRDDLRGEVSLGAVLAHGGARLTVAVTEETRRYDQQSERQRYGEITLGFSF